MKATALTSVLAIVVLGCSSQTGSPLRLDNASEASGSLPAGEEVAMGLAKSYAQEKRWVIYRFPARGRLEGGEWRFVFRVWNGDFLGDYFVYVNDSSGQVRHVRGE